MKQFHRAKSFFQIPFWIKDDFKASLAHPASFGFSVTKFHHGKDTKLEEKSVLDKTKCTEREFIEHLVFPTLMKAMECMLVKAEQSKCFEVRLKIFFYFFIYVKSQSITFSIFFYSNSRENEQLSMPVILLSNTFTSNLRRRIFWINYYYELYL